MYTLWLLILGKIIKFDATRSQILRLKCTKFDFRWGSAPHPAGPHPACSALPYPQLYLMGAISKGRGGRGSGGKRKGRGGKG